MVTGLTLLTGKEAEEEEEGGGNRIPADCFALVARNLLTHPLDDSWYDYHFSLTLEEELPEDPCLSTPPRTVMLQGPGGYQEFLLLCRSLGGDLPTEAALVEAHNCSTGKYLTWASSTEEMDPGPAALCPVLLAGGGAGQRACLRELDCVLCLVPEGLKYTLFGHITVFDRHYTLRTLPDGTFYFQGKITSSIYQGALGWTLSSRLHSEELHQGSWVMGRRRWHHTGLADFIDNSKDSDTESTSKLLTFTHCNALYFSSDNGMCLLRREMCDQRTGSPDGSVQRYCDKPYLIKAKNYDTQVAPFHEYDQQSYISSEVLQVKTIDKITTVEGKASMEFVMLFEWQDSRVELTEFEGFRKFPCEEIWTPAPMFFAGHTVGPPAPPRDNKSNCYFMKLENKVEMQLEDPLMGACGCAS
ncbi:uncharacterized protein LOC126994955, partial [Eriocheir sinensis]|uniref:uncharacterized protein LOC126994955 n=1 Tax=Eriocheir sinensis TaxID=95602 RepID=UPI0021C71357